MNSHRVIVADDHPLARSAIRSLLESDNAFSLVGEASHGEEAYELCRSLQPDLVLMDINMPYCNGLEATRKIKLLSPQIKIVILSVSHDVGDLFTAIQFGAQGYLLKNMEPEEWLKYLHALFGEKTDISREMAGRLFCRFRADDPDEPSPEILTSREQEIIAWVGSGKTNREIAEDLWITENTVKNHIKNILEKLFLHNRVQLAAYALRHGLTVPEKTAGQRLA